MIKLNSGGTMKNLVFILIFSASSLFSYDKINFIGQVSNPNLQNSISIYPLKDKTYILYNSYIEIYDSSYNYVSRIDIKGEKPVSIESNGEYIYVLDNSASKINVYNEKGEKIFDFGYKGSKNGQLSNPSDFKYFNKKLYLANTGLNRIDIFDENGIYLYGFKTMSKDGTKSIEPDKIAIDKSGSIYVVDISNSIIQKYSQSGQLIQEINQTANCISANEYSIVYVANEKEGKIKEFNSNLEFINSFGTRGKGKFEFLNFSDLEVDKSNNILALDNKNKKMLALNLENAQYSSKMPDAIRTDKIRLIPSRNYNINAFSFDASSDTLIYYDIKLKKAYILKGDEKKEILSYGEGEGLVKDPLDFRIYDNKIYASDSGNSRISIFNMEGKYENSFGSKASFFEKNKEGKFNAPSSIAINQKSNIYIADNAIIQTFNKDGIFLFLIGPNISDIKLTKISDIKTDEDGNLYILDSTLKKIIITDPNGKLISAINIPLPKPVSFAYDFNGYIYVLDKELSNVNVFDKKGNFQTSFLASGKGERELLEPEKIKIYGNTIYISDPQNNRLKSFDISYIPERPKINNSKIKDNQINLNWQINNDRIVKKFNIFKGETKEKLEKIAETKELSYTDSDLKSDTTYYYLVSAISITGEENYSEIYSVYFKGEKKIISETPELDNTIDTKNRPPVEIIPVKLNYIFSANYKYYLKNPLGKIVVRNNTEEKFSNVKVSFFLKDYMDFPSDIIIQELRPKTTETVELKATLNNRILSITEDTPVQANITISYYIDSKENTFTLNQPIKILSKNAIVWDNTERIANFITVKDSPIFALSRNILSQSDKYKSKYNFDENVILSAIIWNTLSNYQITYVSDPVNPYSTVKSSYNIITDTVQFPRNTLKLKTGDCDDLTVLLATMLESCGIRVMILDYPGHIALMFETNAENASQVGLPDNLVVKYQNRYFIPIETTLIGKSFYESVNYASEMYRKSGDSVSVVDLRNAMSKYEPVTMPDTNEEFKLEINDESLNKMFDELNEKTFNFYENMYKQAIAMNPDDLDSMNSLAILYGNYSKKEEAKKILQDILSKDEANSPALNNMANLYFLDGSYEKAMEYYQKAYKLDPYDANILLNMSKASKKLGKEEDAKLYMEKAIQLNPELKNETNKI